MITLAMLGGATLIQILWQIRIRRWKMNLKYIYLLMIVFWAGIRIAWHSMPLYSFTRTSDAPIITFIRWLELFGQDIVVIMMLLLVQTWMEVIRKLLNRFGTINENRIVKNVRPIIGALMGVLLAVEIASLLSSAFHYQLLLFINVYWFGFGFELMSLGIFFVVYGRRVQGLLSNAPSKDILQKAHRVNTIPTSSTHSYRSVTWYVCLELL